MSSLQSIMNLDDDQQDASSPMAKKDKDSAAPASGFRVQDPSTSTSSGHGTLQTYSSTVTTPTIRTPVVEASSSSTYYPGQQQTDTDPRSGSAVQQGKRPVEPSLAATSLSAGPSGPGDLRRQSSTSADSMDQHGYGSAASSSSLGGGAGGGGYPPTQPMRPMGSPSPDVPIRLTPITGRVSRAKKGVPVHVCEICNPPKTFTRAEHLRRHQLSHGQPQYECDKCDRAFHRLDLLTRHQQRHNEEGDTASQSGGVSRRGSKDSAASGTLEERRSIRVGRPQPPGYSSSFQFLGGASTPSSISDMPPATPPAGSGSGPAMSPQQGGSGGPSPGHQLSNSGDYYTHHPNPPYQPGSMDSSPEPPIFTNISYNGNTPRTTHVQLFDATLSTSSAMQTALDNPPDLLHPTEYSPWGSASESPYSTPPEAPIRRRNWRHAHQDSIGWHTIPSLLPNFSTSARPEVSTGGSLETMDGPYYVTTSFADSPQLAAHHIAPHIAPAPLHYNNLGSLMTAYHDEQTQSLLDPTIAAQHAMHQRSSSVCSPPPTSTSTSGQVADTLVMPVPLLHRIDSMTQVPQKELVVGDGTEEVSMGVLGGGGSSPHWNGAILTGPGCGISGMMSTALPRSVRNAIPAYVDVYWERFHHFCPIVHRQSFEGTGGEVLRCAMAAIATQFLNGKEDRVRGSQLHEYAWQEAKRSVQWNLQVMQAVVLCELFARFRGRKAAVRPSKLFENLYSRGLYQTPNLYDPALPSGAASLGSHQGMGINTTNEQRWRSWLEAEGRRRLLAGCFIVDNYSSAFQQQPRARDDVDPSTIPLTAHSDALWAANTAEEWAVILEANPAAGRPQCLPPIDALRPEEIARYTVFDQASILNAAALSLPRRYTPRLATDKGDDPDDISHDDLRTPTTASYTQALNEVKPDDRIAHLFSHCVPATTAHIYIALHHTPLHDLLAVSGDSWVFSQKILGSPTFLEHQKRLKAWVEGRSAPSLTPGHHQGTPSSPNTASLEGMSSGKATIYAARALVEYLTRGVDSSNGLTPYMTGLSDYWGMYVCALIIWAFGHRAGKYSGSTGGSSGSPTTKGTPMGEDEAIDWLRVVADLVQPEHAARVRGRREASAAVVSMIKQRLEADCVGGRSRLYVDAVGVLRKLEQGVNWRWF